MSLTTDPKGYWTDLTVAEKGVSVGVVLFAAALLFSLLTGGLAPTYFLYLVGLAGMYALLSLGLNSQWGFSGLINFSVAAFFGIGAYGTALASASGSPIAGGLPPVVGLLAALALATMLALFIGIPTLRLRADYLAIASIGLAEVVRIIVRNQDDWTNGSAGVRGIPSFFEGWPVLETLPETLPTLVFGSGPGATVLNAPFWQALLNVGLVLAFVGLCYLVLRRAHRSPWGRVLRTIRSDEDLARALGKNTYGFKMQSFVLGSLIMALAGVFYAHLNLYVSPGDLDPITTFYVWVAVILGGSGSNRGALFGGVVIVAIREGTRALPVDAAPMRLLFIGLIIVFLMRFRPQGVLPPQKELIWPGTVDETPQQPDSGVRETKAGEQ
ncbi:branched-chain amino acid ABC transporter permease [Haloarcula salinisoli]|uniref:Branched-chain amino acid ABC transporter permease n=1 Tax=Haloarcula salinisoli TaxID=2487746 RepID=A0A8J7YDN3_9EURY|nr:branched-chain amino acid ABC transporter permease [Halomicroarcula salinisoli]MBX0284975.1 branched-chain amino acid ABC transporter permease [Halomicroarcula salinisoli]MBX0303547.1 branched-chain amino acid ABC transporter permease [Halomicroarcula salinisoli]